MVPPMGAPVISKAIYSKVLLFKGYSLCLLRYFQEARRARQQYHIPSIVCPMGSMVFLCHIKYNTSMRCLYILCSYGCLLLAMVYMAFSLGSSVIVISCGFYVMSFGLYTISRGFYVKLCVVVSVAFLFRVHFISQGSYITSYSSASSVPSHWRLGVFIQHTVAPT